MANIPQACRSVSKMQAAYRFLANDDVEFATLLQPHYAATEERISELGQGSVVLVPQDTSSVNYSALQSTPQADGIRRPPPEGDESSGQATLTHEHPPGRRLNVVRPPRGMSQVAKQH